MPLHAYLSIFSEDFLIDPKKLLKKKSQKTIIEVITKLNIKPNKWKEYLVNYPFLFFISFQTITENIEKTIKLLGINKETYVKAALKQPSLFYRSPNTINRNVENAAKLLGINKETYVQAALKYPTLFTLSPNTINVKFDLYNMFIEESPENILNSLLDYPIYFAYAPERIMASYVISKLAGIQLRWDILKNNPNSFAKKILSPDRYQNIFEPLYGYFRKLFERRRKIKRKVGNVEGEVKAIRSHAQRIIEYFGSKEQISLTEEQIQKITELAQKIKNKKFRKESK